MFMARTSGGAKGESSGNENSVAGIERSRGISSSNKAAEKTRRTPQSMHVRAGSFNCFEKQVKVLLALASSLH
jgi:hypothetical protein